MSTTTSSTPNAATANAPDASAPGAMPPPALPSSGAPETTSTAASLPLSNLQTLRNHIQTLTDLNTRLQTLRHIPALLLRPPSGVHALPQASLLRHEFQELKEIAESVRSPKVQDALKAARSSEAAEPKIVGFDVRRDSLKRRRPPSPESPQPYRATGPKSSTFLPHGDASAAPTTLDGLPAYIREYNSSSEHKLHIVAPKKGRPLQCPILLRFLIPDVIVVYLTLERSAAEEQTLIVASATAFGPREQKPTHSQSDYSVYQQLTQQLARVLQSEPWAPLQAVVNLLSSYHNLFTEPCTVCGRVLSSDVHTPPVVRVRREPTADLPSEWGVHHVACKWR